MFRFCTLNTPSSTQKRCHAYVHHICYVLCHLRERKEAALGIVKDMQRHYLQVHVHTTHFLDMTQGRNITYRL